MNSRALSAWLVLGVLAIIVVAPLAGLLSLGGLPAGWRTSIA